MKINYFFLLFALDVYRAPSLLSSRIHTRNPTWTLKTSYSDALYSTRRAFPIILFTPHCLNVSYQYRGTASGRRARTQQTLYNSTRSRILLYYFASVSLSSPVSLSVNRSWIRGRVLLRPSVRARSISPHPSYLVISYRVPIQHQHQIIRDIKIIRDFFILDHTQRIVAFLD